MATKAAKEYQSRGFLDSDKGMAAFEAKVEFWHGNYAFGCFTVSDCNRQIALDFDYSNADERAQRLEKINILIQQLQQLKEALFIEN